MEAGKPTAAARIALIGTTATIAIAAVLQAVELVMTLSMLSSLLLVVWLVVLAPVMWRRAAGDSHG